MYGGGYGMSSYGMGGGYGMSGMSGYGMSGMSGYGMSGMSSYGMSGMSGYGMSGGMMNRGGMNNQQLGAQGQNGQQVQQPHVSKGELAISGIGVAMQTIVHLFEIAAQGAIMGFSCYCTYNQMRTLAPELVGDKTLEAAAKKGGGSARSASASAAGAAAGAAAAGGAMAQGGPQPSLLSQLVPGWMTRERVRQFAPLVICFVLWLILPRMWERFQRVLYPQAAATKATSVHQSRRRRRPGSLRVEELASDADSCPPSDLRSMEQESALDAGIRPGAVDRGRLRDIFGALDPSSVPTMTRRGIVDALRADPEFRSLLGLPSIVRKGSPEETQLHRFFSHMDLDNTLDVTWDEFDRELFDATGPADSTAVALFPWTAQNPDELSFGTDDRLVIHEQDGAWWCASLQGQPTLKGMVPSNYLEMINKNKI